jgi:hypothetical protein
MVPTHYCAPLLTQQTLHLRCIFNVPEADSVAASLAMHDFAYIDASLRSVVGCRDFLIGIYLHVATTRIFARACPELFHPNLQAYDTHNGAG